MLNLIFMLLPAVENTIFSEKDEKNYMLSRFSSCNMQGVLTLSVKVITFYVRVSIIEFRVPNLDKYNKISL